MPPFTIRRPRAAAALPAMIAGAFIVLPLRVQVRPSDPFDVFHPAIVLADATGGPLCASTPDARHVQCQ